MKNRQTGEKKCFCAWQFSCWMQSLFFPPVAPTCQKAGKANTGEFFKGKANVTCEYHVKDFHISAKYYSLSLGSLRPVLQPFIVSIYYQTFIGMSGLVACRADIQQMLEDCKTAVALCMWGRGEIFLLDPWECRSGRNIPYMQLWKAGTADIWRDAPSLCFLCLEPWLSANYMKLCTCWLCHAVFAVWGWFLGATERASRHMRKRS